jgi:hypothetical protein
MSFTIAITSDCFTPGAQYSSAAEGGFPMVHRPATQRLALKSFFKIVRAHLISSYRGRSRSRNFQDRLATKANESTPLTLKEVQSQLDPSTVLLEYWTAENHIAVLWCTRDDVQLITRDLSSTEMQSLRAALDNFPETLDPQVEPKNKKKDDAQSWRKPSPELGGLLPASLFNTHSSIHHVVIVPDNDPSGRYHDAADDHFLPFPFDFEGLPKRRVALVEQGIIRTPVVDKTYADRLGLAPTANGWSLGGADHGHALHLDIGGGDAAREQLIASTKNGIWVTRFNYVNGLLEPKAALMTGTTRDGTFLIRDGEVVARLPNLRWTQSIVEAFSRIEGLSRERRRVSTWYNDVGGMVLPVMKINAWNFS